MNTKRWPSLRVMKPIKSRLVFFGFLFYFKLYSEVRIYPLGKVKSIYIIHYCQSPRQLTPAHSIPTPLPSKGKKKLIV